MRPAQFIDTVLNKHRDRLQASRTHEEIEDIEGDHRELIEMYENNKAVRDKLDNHNIKTPFNDAWDAVPKCKQLRAFCGGLATVFPNTTAVESDFSIVNWELDEYRSLLMQAKQRAVLKQLWLGVMQPCSPWCACCCYCIIGEQR